MADVYVTFGGDASDLEASLATAKASVNAYATELRNLAKEMQATGASADSELGQRMASVAAQLTQAKSAVVDLKTELKGVASEGAEVEGVSGFFERMTAGVSGALGPIGAIKESLGGIVEIVAAAFAVEQIAEFVKSMGELGEQTERTGAQLGLTPEQVGKLNYQFAITGTSGENLVRTMGRFQVSLATARNGTGPVADGLHALGLSAQELIGLSLPEQLEKIADATASFADSPTKTAALQALGRGFLELLPLLDQGSSGMRAFAEQATATNSILTATQQEALVGMNHGFVELGASIVGVKVQGFDVFIPAVNGAVVIMSDFAKQLSESAKQGGSLRDILQGMADAVRILESAVVLLKQTFADLDATVAGPLNAMNDYSEGLGKATREFFGAVKSGDTSDFAATVKANNAQVENDLLGIWPRVQAAAAEAAKEYGVIWGRTAEEVGKKVEGASPAEAKGASSRFVPSMDTSAIEKLNTQIATLTANLTSAGYAAQHTATSLSQWPPANVTFGNAGPFSARTSANDAMTDELKAAMEHLSSQFGAYTVTSTTQGGHAPGSFHYRGEAVDVSTAGMTDAQYTQLITDAIRAGFTGIGISPTHAHLDVRGGDQAQVFPDQPNLAGVAVHGKTPEEWAAALASVQVAPVAAPAPVASSAVAAPNLPEGVGTGEQFPKPDTATVQQWLAELDTAKAKLQEMQDKQAGGNALQKQQNADIAAEASARQNVVSMRQADYDAAQKVVASDVQLGIGGEKYAKDVDAAAKAKKSLREATEAATESELKLGLATAKNAGSAQQEFAAAQRLAQYKLQIAGADVSAQNAAKTELMAAETTYENAVRAQIIETQRTAIQSAHERAKGTEVSLDEELKLHQINMTQWLQQTTAALEQEKDAVTAAYQIEINAAQGKTDQVERIMREEQQTLAQIALQEQQDQAKAAEASAQNWQKATSEINSAFDAQVDGLLTGTETWGQALKKVITSLTEDLIKFFLNWALTSTENYVKQNLLADTWLGHMLGIDTAATVSKTTSVGAQTAVVTTGVATQTAAQTAGASEGAIASLAGIVTSIGASVGQVFAGVSGFLAPIIGPAAPAAGAAAAASVDAGALAYLAADTGAWQLADDTLVGAHAGEMIIPQKGGIASEFRDFMARGGFGGAKSSGNGTENGAGGAGGVTVAPTAHYHVNALDTKAGADWLRDNSHHLAKAMDQAVRRGATLGLRGLSR